MKVFTTQFVTELVLLDSGHQPSIQHYKYCSYLLEVKQLLTDMAVNISGMRDTTRVLKISSNSVTKNPKNFHRYGR
ncbi:IS1-like element transposase [Nostoc sp.]|uniref:IS1-like element transposase n=1 Tax=Nostoc sp. TaxID=1180 RepID=UPI002FF49471